MLKLILLVLAIIAVATAQFFAAPYYGYSAYGVGYPVAYSAYTPYAYSSYLYK